MVYLFETDLAPMSGNAFLTLNIFAGLSSCQTATQQNGSACLQVLHLTTTAIFDCDFLSNCCYTALCSFRDLFN